MKENSKILTAKINANVDHLLVDPKSFFPLKCGGIYLVRYGSYTSGNLWQANVESVTDICYLINGKWYLKGEFEYKYRVFEEVEKMIDTEGAIKYVTKK